MTSPLPPVFGETIALTDVEKQLALLSGKGRSAGAPPVQWARMSNLVIYCDNMDQAVRLAHETPVIVTAHPARVLLLIGEGEGNGNGISAAVQAWCKVGRGQQAICSDQITLHASKASAGHLPFAVRSLLLGNLPTNVYWAAPVPPAMGGAVLHDLADRAQQVIFDSIGWTDPPRGMSATVTWLSGFERRPVSSAWRVASDLNWRRLKYWRRLMGQALDPAVAPGALESITEVLVEHGPHAVLQAWELASWLAARLGWKVQKGRFEPGVQLAWQCQAAHGPLRLKIHRLGEGPSEVTRVRITCALNGAPGALVFSCDGDYRLAVRTEGLDAAPRTVTAQRPDLSELVARQLSDREYDPVFHESMKVAQVLAQSVLH